jgi:hypothetical protein
MDGSATAMIVKRIWLMLAGYLQEIPEERGHVQKHIEFYKS